MTSDSQLVQRHLAKRLSRLDVARGGAILRLLECREAFAFVAVWGPGAEGLLDPKLTIPRQSIAGWVVERRQPMWIRDAQKNRRHFRIVDRVTGENTRGMFALPFVRRTAGGLQCHVLELLDPTPRADLVLVAQVLRSHGGHPIGWGDSRGIRGGGLMPQGEPGEARLGS